MGFAPRAVVLALLTELRDSEAAGRAQLIRRARAILPKVRDDALHRQLTEAILTLENAESQAG